MSEKVELRKVREFGEIINDTFLFIKQNFKPLMKAFIYLCGFFVLAGVLTGVLHQINIQKLTSSAQHNYGFYNETFTARAILNAILLIIVSILDYTAITVTILSFMALYIDKGNVAPNVDEVWAYFKYYFFRVLVGVILVFLFSAICFICCVIPGIYVFPAMSLFFSIMIFENATAGYCFSRSFKLLKDQWWITAATILIIFIITYAATMFVLVPGILVGLIQGFMHSSGEISIGILILSTVLQHIAQVFLVVPTVCVALCYFNLRERQESTGLMERVGQLGANKSTLDSAPEEY